eukprot:scaffold938_cov91-Skeletonema_dohrnii-CCMP3373.AAC.3
MINHLVALLCRQGFALFNVSGRIRSLAQPGGLRSRVQSWECFLVASTLQDRNSGWVFPHQDS